MPKFKVKIHDRIIRTLFIDAASNTEAVRLAYGSLSDVSKQDLETASSDMSWLESLEEIKND